PRGTRTVPLRPPVMRPSLRTAVRGWLASGVAIVDADFPAPGSPMAAVAGQAGVRFPSVALWLGSGGVLVAPALMGRLPVMLRVFPPGTGEGHAHAVSTLTRLRGLAGQGLVPALHGSGRTDGLDWLVETRLAGTRPRRLTQRLASEAVDFTSTLPLPPGPVVGAEQRLPQVLDAGTADRLAAVGRAASSCWSGVPAVGTHGDLWLGNLLADHGALSGVVDWDAYRGDVVPGLDLVHLLATEERLRQRRSMGAELLSRPWEREPLRSLGRRYFSALGVHLDEDRWTATGNAWWLGQVASTLTRTPALARDARWMQANVVSVLDVVEHRG
ncbi:MAG: phosphotransferase, partial [Nocardioidaceae bacterium]